MPAKSSRIRRKTKTVKKKTSVKKPASSLWFFPNSLKVLKGDASIFILFGIILIGGLFMAGGFFPRVSTDTLNTDAGESQIDPDSLPKGDSKEALQLKTLKFKSCTQVSAVEFLLDNSGSMGGSGFDPAKMTNLKAGVTTFSEKLSDTSVIGLRTFSDYTTLDVPFGYYKDNKSSFATAIAGMTPDGSTHQKSAFEAAKTDLEGAVTKYPKYDFNLIFFSDGIPETAAGNRTCTGTVCDPSNPAGCRCMAPSQDPRAVAEEIKAIKNSSGSNIRIFSILLYDPVRDSFAETEFKALMKSVATDSSTYFETTDPDDLKSLFDSVIKKVCG